MAHDVFNSYSMKDRAVADAVCATLERRKIRCWIAPRDAPGRVSYAESIVDAIDESRFMVLILSSNSNDSAHVTREVERAASRGTLVIPFRIEDVSLSKSLQYFIGPVHWLDALTPPLEKHLNHLANTIEWLLKRLEPGPRPRPAPSPGPVWGPEPTPMPQPAHAPQPASMPQPTPTLEPVPVPQPKPGPMPGGAPPSESTGGRGFPIAEVIGGLLAGAMSVLGGLLHLGGRDREDTAQVPTARSGEAPETRAARQPYSPSQAEAPSDHVHFSVTSPPAVQPGARFVVNVWAHLAHQRSDMLQRAQAALGGVRPAVQSKGPTRVMRGSVLAVRLRIEDLLPQDSEDTILWEGEISNATFGVTVPPEARPGGRAGTVRLYAEGLEIARIHFAIEVGQAPVPRPDTTVTAQAHRSAFASYASEDRDAVLARIQGILKVAPALDIFIDVANMRSGQDWEATLRREILVRDVFYLFWSEYARRSKVVDWEWRYALQTRGLDFIDPVPLASPDRVPPPPELAGKHFNDWMLAYMRTAKSTVGERLSDGSRPAG